MRPFLGLLRHVRRRLRARWDRFLLATYTRVYDGPAPADPCDGFSCAVCACPTGAVADGRNYTRPGSDRPDAPSDWLNAMLILGAAVGHLLEDDTGVVVDLTGDMRDPSGSGATRVVVMSVGGRVAVDRFPAADVPAGTLCRVEHRPTA